MYDDRITTYLRDFAPETDALRQARTDGDDAGIPSVSPEAGALLAWCARLVGARHAVEIGTGGGYSGLWLLTGMAARGSLTTIELDPEHQAVAQRAFADAGVADRVRSMLGPALAVLPKLADDHYELVFLDAASAEYGEYLPHAKRLLRPGGVLLAGGVLRSDVTDPEDSDPDAQAQRSFARTVRDDPELDATIVPVGEGLLVSVHRPEGDG